MVDLTELIVYVAKVLIEVLKLLLRALTLLVTHFAVPRFRNHLSLCNITLGSDFSRLLNAVPHQHTRVSFSLKLLPIVAHLLVLSYHAHAPVSVESCVGYLCLEGQLFYLGHVDVVQCHQLRNRLNRVLERKD